MSSISTIENYEYECTKKCRNRHHGDIITSVLTKREVSDKDLACFIAKSCRNFAQNLDNEGRSALHMASSTGRYSLIEWLLNHGADINIKDQESGSSALHRAIYYGCIDCAVLLIRYGANFDSNDRNYLKPLQYVCKINEFNFNVPSLNELLVWGKNRNYNLGIGNEQKIDSPQYLDYFRRQRINIKSVALSSYHSLFLDDNGRIYSVGHGQGGRLGIDGENISTIPFRVHLPPSTYPNYGTTKVGKNSHRFKEHAIQISCSKYHSMVLTDKSSVFACGLNKNYQLGFEEKPKDVCSFKEIVWFRQSGIFHLKQIIAKDNHSIAFNDKQLFVWGKNCGQFGISNDETSVILPRMIYSLTNTKTISLVVSTNSAMACCISGLQINLYYNYKTRIFKYPAFKFLIQVCLTEETEGNDSKKFLKMLVFTDSGEMYIWYETLQQHIKCNLFPMNCLTIEKIFYKNNQILILSNGDVYEGKVTKLPVQFDDDSTATLSGGDFNNESSYSWDLNTSYTRHELCLNYIIKIDLKYISSLDRVIDIFCDDDLESFAALQEDSRKYFRIPKESYEKYNFKNLLNDSNEFDQIHDVVFHVDDEKFVCHKLIIYSRSKGLMRIIKQHEENQKEQQRKSDNVKHIILKYENLTAKIFEIILKFIYTNYYITEEDLEDISRSLGMSRTSDLKNTARIFLKFAEEWELVSLALLVKSYCEDDKNSLDDSLHTLEKYFYEPIEHTAFPELYDITIKCSDGSQIKAHKCVLVSRSEYFNVMLNNNWSKNNIINLNTISYEYVKPLIEYLYTLNESEFEGFSTESYLYNMIIICDQLLIYKLSRVCETMLLSRLSIRKCGDMLEFARTYNCNLLQKGCLEFICHNLHRILIHRSLDDCDVEVLKLINNYYRKMFKEKFDYRMILPYSCAVNDSELLKFIKDFHIDLNYKQSKDSIVSSSSLSKNKIKSKNNNSTSKLAQSKRDYEKQAINSMNKLLLAESGFDAVSTNLNSNMKDKEEDISSKYQENNESLNLTKTQKSWTKVIEKKDKKKSITINTPIIAVKCNNIMKEEKQQSFKNDFVNLNNLTKDNMDCDKEKNIENNDKSPTTHKNRSNFSFGDLTPQYKSKKVSQKQRKRLSSESKSLESNNNITTSSQQQNVSPSTPIPIKNPWNTTSVKSPDAEDSNSPIEILSTSFAEIMKSQSLSTNKKLSISPDNKKSSVVNASTGAISKNHPDKKQHQQLQQQQAIIPSAFTKIVEEEKKQKEYYEKMKNKSLVLTQIEETAISELELFYNVDNVFDERITIERKPQYSSTMNFVVWQCNQKKE